MRHLYGGSYFDLERIFFMIEQKKAFVASVYGEFEDDSYFNENSPEIPGF